MDKGTVLFIVFLIIFSATAVITLLGITHVIKNIRPRYLNALFTALILEVVAAVILTYKQMDYGEASFGVVQELFDIAPIKEKGDSLSEEQKGKALIQFMGEVKENPPDSAIARMARLQLFERRVRALNDSLKSSHPEMSEQFARFYDWIVELQAFINQFAGNNINLVYRPAKKKEAFELMHKVLETIAPFSTRESESLEAGKVKLSDFIVRKYVRYLKNRLGIDTSSTLLSKDENGYWREVILNRYTIRSFVRTYVDKLDESESGR